MDTKKIEEAISQIIYALGDNPNREGLLETPKRVAKMFQEVFEGMQYSNEEIAEMYGKTFEVPTNQIVKVDGIKAFSYCEHHLALMYNMDVDVAYIPNGKVIGLSKIPRIVEMCCKRLQLQERIGEDIADVISIATGSKDIYVRIRANHSCVTARGIKARESLTETITCKGRFEDLQLLQMMKG